MSQSNTKPSAAPTRKVAYGAAINGVIGIAAWYLRTYQAIDIPGEVQGMVHTVAVFAVQYMVPDA